MEKKLWQQIFMYGLAGLLFLGFFGILVLLILHAVPEANSNVLFTLVGVLGTCFVAVVTYFFGSSKGSADKTEMLNGKLKNNG